MSTQAEADPDVNGVRKNGGLVPADGVTGLAPPPFAAQPAHRAGLRFPERPVTDLAFMGAAAFVFAAPAIWNGFPFLFWDTGGYLDAGIDRAIVPGRSMVYGLLLSAGRWPSFWPVVALQCLLTAWMIALLFRVQGLARRHLAYLVTCVALAAVTALPFVAAQLMPDIFAALAPLGLYLLLFKGRALKRWEAALLVLIIVFAGGAHGSVLATMLVLFALALLSAYLLPGTRSLRIRIPALALVAALLVTPTLNLVLAGRFVPTPGGMAFVFGRLLEDGMIDRYLLAHCPDPQQPLCYYRDEMPSTADDFLWDNDDVFVALGGIEKGLPYMRSAVIGALLTFPLDNLALAARAFARQVLRVETGDSLFNYLTDSTEAIAALVPSAVPAMEGAHQQAPMGLDFTRINEIQVPVTLASVAVLALVGIWLCFTWRRGDGRREAALLCVSVLAILLVNAAVCGILSNPVNRYQARVAWLAIPTLAIVALSASGASRRRWPGRP
ncbi:hypothetical protein J5J86_12010 [Aquabacter sp. L1I39]|uniref:hypothetical protein n=1 Tax=Aquabacter sp. L1I39 TaxID=2820278 RepID=UPI001AD95D10|nr:hypothetical protein [Aquabacter sp. L1I39]QTL01557.1 hypothetical protein J5J86_12010 [Aquabacter sp. L1I39]